MIVPLLSFPRSLRKPWDTRKVPLMLVSCFFLSIIVLSHVKGGTYEIRPPLIRIHISNSPSVQSPRIVNQHIGLSKLLLYSLPKSSDRFGVTNIGDCGDDLDVFVDCQDLFTHFVEWRLLAGDYDDGLGSCFGERFCESLGLLMGE